MLVRFNGQLFRTDKESDVPLDKEIGNASFKQGSEGTRYDALNLQGVSFKKSNMLIATILNCDLSMMTMLYHGESDDSHPCLLSGRFVLTLIFNSVISRRK